MDAIFVARSSLPEVWNRAHNHFSVYVHVIKMQLALKFLNTIEYPIKRLNLLHDFWINLSLLDLAMYNIHEYILVRHCV